ARRAQPVDEGSARDQARRRGRVGASARTRLPWSGLLLQERRPRRHSSPSGGYSATWFMTDRTPNRNVGITRFGGSETTTVDGRVAPHIRGCRECSSRSDEARAVTERETRRDSYRTRRYGDARGGLPVARGHLVDVHLLRLGDLD